MYFDYTWIQIPALNLEFNPDRMLSIGNFNIYYYGVIIAVGLMLAILYGWKRAKQFGLKVDDITDGVLWIVPVAVLCARLYYVAFKWEDYAENPISIFFIHKGGLAIYGGVIGAAICTIIHCRIKKMNLFAVLDLVALGFLIGQCVGRWGNFFNREAFGAETDSFLRMGLWNTSTGEYDYHHPTFFYESVWNFVGFIVLHFLSKKRKYDGQIALGYVAWYGLGRTVIEGLRTDSLYMGPFRVSQLLAAVSCFAAVVILLVLGMKKHDPAKLNVNVVAAMEAAEALEAEEECGEEEYEEETAEDAVAEETAEEAEESEDEE